MKVLKYLLLLILLLIFGLTVFIATQKGTYSITRTKLISASPTTVFNYVNDLHNWENFYALKMENKSLRMSFPGPTIGRGGAMFWRDQDDTGYIKTTASNPTKSIVQTCEYEGNDAKLHWTFIDSVGQTKATLRIDGEMNFKFKVYATFTGGAEKILAGLAERSLDNLESSLDKEMNVFKAEITGIVTGPSGFYLGQRIRSKSSNVALNLRIMVPKLVRFFTKNNIPITGKPFVIYHSTDVVDQIVDMTVCMPMVNEIFIKSPSDVVSGKLEPFTAVKTMVTGDYSHLENGWQNSREYLKKNNIAPSAALPKIERYVRGADETRRPSEWITELFMPVQIAVPDTEAVSAPVIKTTSVVPKRATTPISVPINEP